MAVMQIAGDKSTYSAAARALFEELDRRVNDVYAEFQEWRGWKLFSSPDSTDEELRALIREIFRAVSWYQAHTTEAGFHMFGRLPKTEGRLMQLLATHKADEAEHGVWAREDHGKLGGLASSIDTVPASPAAFAVAAVWWRIAQCEDPFGYLGAEYLFEQLTALVTPAVLPIIDRRGLSRDSFRFISEHATEDVKHATFLKHLILDTVTRRPETGSAMLRCFDYFRQVYPFPVWEEAFSRAFGAAEIRAPSAHPGHAGR